MIVRTDKESNTITSNVIAVDSHSGLFQKANEMESGILSGFEIVSSADIEMSSFRRRYITKYVIPDDLLVELINDCKGKYKLLERCSDLQSDILLEYYDTTALKFFNDHVNGKLNRLKVRIRNSYKNEDKVWEIWRRKSKGRMIKKRVPINGSNIEFEEKAGKMVSEYAGIDLNSLTPSLLASFSRITLLNPESNERITIDTNICFASPKHPEKQKHVAGLVIIELRKRRRASSFLADLLARHSIRPVKISKYCLGISLTNRCAKTNSYKPIIRNIEKTILHGHLE